MEEKRNHSSRTNKIAWDMTPTANFNRNPGLRLAASKNFASSVQRKSTIGRPRSRIPRFLQRTKKGSNQDHERAITIPRKEERDECPCERQTHSTPMRDTSSSAFYNRIGLPFPKAIENKVFENVVQTADMLLGHSKNFADKTFYDLEDMQQGVLAFEVSMDIHEYLMKKCDADLYEAAQCMEKTWVTKPEPTPEHMRMWSFVLKGGDIVEQSVYDSLVVNKSHCGYYEDNSRWSTNGAVNIFNKTKTKPVLYIQDENSLVCAYVSTLVVLIYSDWYFGHNTGQPGGLFDPSTGRQGRPNLSKVLRDEGTAEKLTGMVMGERKGARLGDAFELLVKCFGAHGCGEVKKLNMHDDDENLNYLNLRKFLENGRPVACSIETFAALFDKRKKQYYGNISDVENRRYNDKEFHRLDKKDRVYHSVVIIGITPGVAKNGPMLLIQDSCKHRPFFEMSLRLLMSMGIEKLGFFTVSKDWKFGDDDDYIMPECFGPSIFGSPGGCTTNRGLSLTPAPVKKKHHCNIRDYCIYVEEGESVMNII